MLIHHNQYRVFSRESIRPSYLWGCLYMYKERLHKANLYKDICIIYALLRIIVMQITILVLDINSMLQTDNCNVDNYKTKPTACTYLGECLQSLLFMPIYGQIRNIFHRSNVSLCLASTIHWHLPFWFQINLHRFIQI